MPTKKAVIRRQRRSLIRHSISMFIKDTLYIIKNKQRQSNLTKDF